MSDNPEGWRELRRDLRRLSPTILKDLNKALKVTAGAAARAAQAKAPKRSGKLARKIKVSVTNKGVQVVSSADYGRIVEFGGRHPVFGQDDNWVFQPAEPHIFPATEAHREQATRDGLAAIDSAAREAGLA